MGLCQALRGIVPLVVTVGSLGVIGWVMELLGCLNVCFDRMQLIKYGKALL